MKDENRRLLIDIYFIPHTSSFILALPCFIFDRKVDAIVMCLYTAGIDSTVAHRYRRAT